MHLGRVILAGAIALAGLQARAAATDNTTPILSHKTPASLGAGETELQVEINHKEKVFPQVFWRTPGGAYRSPLEMKPVAGHKNTYAASLPRVDGGAVEYYLEAYDELGNGPGRVGQPEAPIKLSAGAAHAAAPAASGWPGHAAAAPAAPAPVAASSTTAAATPAAASSTASGWPTATSTKTAPAPTAPAAAPAAVQAAQPATAQSTPASPPAPSAHAAPAPQHAPGSQGWVTTTAATPAPAREQPAPVVYTKSAAAGSNAVPASAVSAAPLSLSLDRSDAPLSRRGAVLRSLALPGWGQWSMHEQTKGAVFMGAAAVGVIASATMIVRAHQANSVYESAPFAFRNAAYDQASSYATGRNFAIAATVAVWALAAADAYFLYQR